MRKRKYTFGVFIGRFEPPHNAHLQVMLEGLEAADKLIVVIGSARAARNTKNPFTAEERQDMILQSLLDAGANKNKILFTHVRDYFYNENMWLADVQAGVLNLTRGNTDIALLGHEKDESSYYLRSFPEWAFIPTRVKSPLNSTDLRKIYFEEGVSENLKANVPGAVSRFLTEFQKTEDYQNLKGEHQDIKAYKELWKAAPFPPTFVTTDAVVVKSGHVLLIRRAANPGKGKLAMPGGFLEIDEKLITSCIRELREETGIQIDNIETYLKDQKVFDYPTRSLRGRTITHAFHFDLGIGQLPKVQGLDDASEALWVPISDVFAHPEWFFEDHYIIIEHFLLKN